MRHLEDLGDLVYGCTCAQRAKQQYKLFLVITCIVHRLLLLLCRQLLLALVTGTRWMPGIRSLAAYLFELVESMQSLYTYVEC
jgi:hypothetical protein